jgi:hypothetical protein
MYKKVHSKYYMARRRGDFVFFGVGKSFEIDLLGQKENGIEEKTYTINIVCIGYCAC